MNAASRQPVSGPDFTRPYVALNDDGTWGSEVYHKVRDLRPGVGEYMDRHGGLCEIPHHRLKLVAFEHAPEPEPTPEEKVAANEQRRYRSRSRVSAQQRANAKASDKQKKYIVFLGRQRGLDLDDLRAMAPRKSLSDLSVREASQLIDRLKR